ncbi:MAG TPA: MATE family efflux transporter [Candidatus Mediterraneibacter pullistercoris]|nr:MATE family efflux transporter [Candidatus Mediterraneibacter pullistercoris]
MNSKNRQIFFYILPSAGGLCVTYLYNIVDGIFVGRGVGALALAAVNITVPFITTLVALSTLFAMGGSTVIAIRLGRGDKKGANDAFMTALVLTLLLSILLLIAGMAFPEQIARLCGSSEQALPLAKEYLFFYTAFAIPFLLSNCLAIFVRNDGAPGLSFWGMCAGAAANIFLDWLFIFPMQMGIMGAAVASGLGQLLSFVILISHFIRKKGNLRICRYTPSFALMKKICNRGVPECFSQLNTPVTAFCYNWALSGTLGDMGVATFSVLSFIYSLANAILSGVAQGLQPLWGLAYGRNDKKELRNDFRAGMKINLTASVVIYVILAIFRVPAVRLFNNEPELVEMASKALPVFALSFLFMAVNLIFTAYYYSTKQTWKSNIIAVSRGIVIKAAAIFLVPVIFGEAWVWAAAAAAEAATLAVIFIIRFCTQEKKC